MSNPMRETQNDTTSGPSGNAPPFHGQHNSHQQRPLPGDSSKSSKKPNGRWRPNQSGDSGQTNTPAWGQAQTNSRSRPNPSTSRGDNAWNNQQIYPKRTDGPRSNPQSSAGGYSRIQNVSRPNQGSVDQSKDNFENTEGSSAKPKSELPDIVKEIKKDLFDMPEEYALAHCVGSDFIMSSGVAVNFRKKFRLIPDLLDQNKNPGQVAYLNYSGRYIYYLVTKIASNGKPTWDDFEIAVTEWSRLCVEHHVTKIAIPKIGCGRDQLDWNRVKKLLNEQFANLGIEIIVCVIDQETAPPPKWNLKLKHTKEPLSLLDPRECALVFVASKDHSINASINRLAAKYGFTTDYSQSQLGLGSIYQFTNKATKVNIFGLVVKEKQSDPISFRHLGACLQALRRAVKKLHLYYMGFEAFDDPKFASVTRKLWTAVIDTFFVEDIEVYICWPEDVKERNWEERALQ